MAFAVERTAPMSVAAILMLDSEIAMDPAAVRAAIAERIRAVPRLRQRLMHAPFGCGRPYWVDDPDFDIANHFRHLRCPEPGDEAALLGVAADTVTRRLLPDRPLWSATLVTGLAGGGAAMILLLHHVLADGIGGLAVLAHLVDGCPVAMFDRPRPPPRRRELFVDAQRGRWQAMTHLAAGVRRLRSAVAELAPQRTVRAPRSSLNRPIGTQRRFVVARSDLTLIKAVARDHGATVNDVILSAVTGALRTLLSLRGETVERLVIAVPVSSRLDASDKQLGNDVGSIPMALPASGEPPLRLAAIAHVTRGRKTGTPGASAAILGPAFGILARLGAFEWLVSHQHLVNTFVTNLRGPSVRLSFLGAPIGEVIPLSTVAGNTTVAFAALSYAGSLVITVIADPQLCPDLDVLGTQVQRELDALIETLVS